MGGLGFGGVSFLYKKERNSGFCLLEEVQRKEGN